MIWPRPKRPTTRFQTMKTLTLTALGAVLCLVGIGCSAKGSIKTGRNSGAAAAAVRVGYTTAPAAAQK